MPYDEDQVRAALARVWPDHEAVAQAQVRAIDGGLYSRSFLVGVSQRRFVLRLPLDQSVALLNLAAEVRAMRAAAGVGIAPAVVAFDASAGLLLTEYHPSPAGRVPEMRRMAGLLRLLHSLDVDLPVYVTAEIARRYLAALDARAFSPTEHRWASELLLLARDFDARHAPTAFCHNDLYADNVLDDGAALRLVDFEYAVRGSPLLDLAGFAGMNDLGVTARRELLAAYYGDTETAATLADLDAAIRMLRLLSYFWARMAEQGESGGGAFARLAARLQATLT